MATKTYYGTGAPDGSFPDDYWPELPPVGAVPVGTISHISMKAQGYTQIKVESAPYRSVKLKAQSYLDITMEDQT